MFTRILVPRVPRPLARPMSASSKSRHGQYYSDLLPAMVPVALLGSAVYLGLQLLQSNLSHEKHLEAANARVAELEAKVQSLIK